MADDGFFRSLHGRSVPVLATNYLLPVDDDERRRSDLHHRMIQFVFAGRNYVGPVKEALQFGQPRKILDLGTGGGHWAIDMADEFPRAEVIGIDIAPIQPQYVPPNCTFEICDLNQVPLPYPAASFDLIHARSILIAITNYPRMLREIARLLRPGGLVLLVEPDLHPLIGTQSDAPDAPLEQQDSGSGSDSDSSDPSSHRLPNPRSPPSPPHPPPHSHLTTNRQLNLILNPLPEQQQQQQQQQQPRRHSATGSDAPPHAHARPRAAPALLQGWRAFWETLRTALRRQNLDTTVPARLAPLLAAAGAYENIVRRQANVPVGFWPQDPHLLTVGQLQWMDYELLLPALRPLFLAHAGLAPADVDRLIQAAQHDLYYPPPDQPLLARIHIVYASKRLS